MKLSDIKGKAALKALADIMEYVSVIMADEKIKEAMREKDIKKIVPLLLKTYPDEVIAILAITEGEEPKTYESKVNMLTLPAKLIEIFNDEELMSLFHSQGQMTDTESSVSATENTEV